jgi:hypothetical protein
MVRQTRLHGRHCLSVFLAAWQLNADSKPLPIRCIVIVEVVLLVHGATVQLSAKVAAGLALLTTFDGWSADGSFRKDLVKKLNINRKFIEANCWSLN